MSKMQCEKDGIDPATVPPQYRHLHSCFVLAGDIGGTNARFAIYDVAGGPHNGNRIDGSGGTRVFSAEYRNSKFASFEEVVCHFLDEAKLETRPRAACFAVAGPVSNNVVVLTNIKAWIIDGNALEQTLNIPRVRIINDFSGIGFGLLTLEDSETRILQEGEHQPEAPILCIGAGTGLGECFLTFSSDRGGEAGQYEVFPSEGGHTDFAPHGRLQVELAEFIAKKYMLGEDRISVERVVSGQGIADTYDFLRNKFPERADQETSKAFDAAHKDDKAAIVNTASASGKCKLADEAIEIFLEAYGSEVGNCALKYLPAGGIYIAGGLMPRFLDRLERSKFKTAFLNKGRMSKLIRLMPLKVVTDETIGLRGAKLCAAREVATLQSSENRNRQPSQDLERPPVFLERQRSSGSLRVSVPSLLMVSVVTGAVAAVATVVAMGVLRSQPGRR